MTEQAETVDWQQPVVGQSVRVVDENYIEHDALVTAVHGTGYNGVGPSVNVVYVSADLTKHDPYGQQLERLSSLIHFNGTVNMPKRGRYWIQ